jgi:hypothetical protein
MDKKASEMLAQALAHLNLIPSFDGAILFPEDIADVTGFQIRGTTNTAGRMVFTVHAHTEGDLTYAESVEIFKEKYKEIHGNPIRDLKKHDINVPKYPSFGSDYIEDLSPATIVRILRVSFETDNNAMGGILTAYIMRLTQEVSRWANHFEMLAKNTRTLATCFEKILEEDL